MNKLAKVNTEKQLSAIFKVETVHWKIRYYGRLGFSNRAIRKRTGYSDYRIYKILKEAGIKRIEYRDMATPLAKLIGSKLDDLSERRLVLDVQQYLLK